MKNTNQAKAQKGFFEVEGIEGVFEGVHIGERYSYGVVPYFTMKTCLEIIKHNYDPFYVSYDFDTDKKTFVEIWIEDGKSNFHYASKIEVDNITYYNIGNGWSWIYVKEYEMIKRNMDGTILKVIKQSDFDRYVFITYFNDEIVGLNFHQGLEKIDYYFIAPCPHLTEIYRRLTNFKFSGNNLTQQETISKAIQLYIDAFVIQY
jgi:hypothetical protein